MDIAAEIVRIEQRAQERDVSIRAILQRAGLATSNWARWKRGKSSPSFKTWGEVSRAAADLLSGENSQASGDTARRDASASPGPKPDKARSLSGAQNLDGGGA
ncbi:hypothetical protein EOW77_0032245 [Bradyrhizobium yuanmingense]|uniref:hypothetical protein n=1 Tax=Bradyrhizobium yuanmingense TaxID=108015 RepID=UPI000FE2B0BC|nr:hypothetical protein [Bradyrhizobium yuanmingense]TGN75941.1 hypothetical protein EOW77_0032245 [Bradyrhizobium yuanmingense]